MLNINPINANYNNAPQIAKRPTFKGAASKFLEISGTQTKAKIYTDNVNYQTLAQIKSICSHPVFRDIPIRIMPDTHASRSSVVGFTAPINTKGEIIPSIIGNDIGCGMLCCEIDVKPEAIDYQKLDKIIGDFVIYDKDYEKFMDKKYVASLSKEISDICATLNYADYQTQMSRLGTLGGGNHFIEIDKDKNNKVFLIIHTGSRNLGAQLAQKYEHIATLQNPYKIKSLSYLSGDEAKSYLESIKIAQQYAKCNRRLIADEIIKKMGWKEIDSFENIHNYIDQDSIIRKGAINSGKGNKLIIPLNMRDGALVGEGKGNPDWNYSAPHGAGRILTRNEAKKTINIDEYKKSMEGIYSSCLSPETLDECPQAYKNAFEIEQRIKDSVKIINKLQPIYNFKVSD